MQNLENAQIEIEKEIAIIDSLFRNMTELSGLDGSLDFTNCKQILQTKRSELVLILDRLEVVIYN